MKLSFNRAELQSAMTLIVAATSESGPNTILACALLSADSTGVRLTSTNGQLSVRVSLPQSGAIVDGSTLIRARRLADILKEVATDVVTIETRDDTAIIRAGEDEFTLYTHAPEGYPAWSDEPGVQVEVPLKTAMSMYGKIKFAVLPPSMEVKNRNYVFYGILLFAGKRKFEMVACDGRRIARAFVEAKIPDGGKYSVIVPVNAVALLDKVKGDNQLVVTFRDNGVQFNAGSVTIRSSVMEGTFPDYMDTIPSRDEQPIRLAVDRAGFLGAVRRASLFEDDDGGNRVSLDFTESNVRLQSSNPSAGQTKCNFPCKLEGGPLSIRFASQYLQDGLRAAESDEVLIDFKSPILPAVLREEGYEYSFVPLDPKGGKK